MFGILATKDAHGLFEEFDFLINSELLMCRIPDFLRKAEVR
jgi:hypothetical protein